MAAPGGARTGATTDRPRFIVDTILLNGEPESLDMGLFRSPDGFPLPFSTYLSAGMVAEWSGRGEEGIRFVANFGGQTDRDAFLHARVLAPDDDRDADAVAAAYQGVDGRALGNVVRPVADLSERYPFAEHGWDFTYDADDMTYVGTLLLLSRDDHRVRLVVHQPAGYGRGFGPRSDAILEHWRWEDGTPLR